MLQLYTSHNSPAISTGDHSNPVIVVVDGSKGESISQRLFLHNDDSSKYYEDIVVWVESVPDNWSIKLIAQRNRPTEEQWAQVSSGNSITFTQIGSPEAPNVDYHPFWIRVEVPPGTPTETISNVAIKARMMEFMR